MLSRRRLLLLGGGAVAASPAAASETGETAGPSGPGVDVRRFGAVGDGRRDDSRAIMTAVHRALSARLTGGGVAAIRLSPGRFRLSRSLWIDRAVAVELAPGAEFVLDPDVTITIQGGVFAGPQRIFSGRGKVRLSQPGPVSVLWFGAEDGKESTEAFRRAIEAVAPAKAVTWRQGRGIIEVPPTRTGFGVNDLRIPSGIRLRGAGANSSRLVNNSTSGEPLLVVAESDGMVVRDVRIEGLYLEGNPSSGDGIQFHDHGYNEVIDCFVRGHGGDGIVGRKRLSTMSDGLSLTDVYLTDNKGVGLRLERNSHGCAAKNCVLVNNARGNAVISGTYFNMWGGMVNGVEGHDAMLFEGVNCGGLWGVGFEATPVVKTRTTLLRLVRVRSLVIAGCNFVASGNDGNCVFLAVDNAQDSTVLSPFFDANSKGNVVALSIGRASENLQVVSPRFGKNHGSGSFTGLENRSATTAVVSGHNRPLLPAFIALLGNDARLVGGGRRTVLRFDSLIYGSETGLFGSGERFVAPVDGIYHFDAQLWIDHAAEGDGHPVAALRTDSETIPGQFCHAAEDGKGKFFAAIGASIRLGRGQEAVIEVTLPGDINSATLQARSRFAGYLVA